MRRFQELTLWTGSTSDARDLKRLLETGVVAVVDVAMEELPAQLPRDRIYCRFPLIDGSGNDEAVLRQAVLTTFNLLAAGIPTLVACSAGLSRSPTIAAFALASHLKMTSIEALTILSKTATALDVSGAFWNEVSRIFDQKPVD